MKKVLVHGPILTRTGYGEMARFALKSLLKYPDRFDVYINNITWGTHPSWIIEPEMRDLIDALLIKTVSYASSGGKFDISIQCTIPPEYQNFAQINIGYTAGIETTKAHPSWLIACNNMDKVITISSFSKNILESSTHVVGQKDGQDVSLQIAKKVEYLGFPVKTLESKEVEGLELESDFNFLAVGQYGPRKNYDNLISWFVETFENRSDVGLVLKLNYLNSSKMDEYWVRRQIGGVLARFKNRKCPIYLVSGNLSDQEMNYLYQNPKIKALINISHGEGFGIPMFEASYNAMPVITCGWGGQTDFLTFIRNITTVKDNGKKKTTKVKKTCFAEVDYTIGPIQDFAVTNNITVKDSKWCFPDRKSYCETLKKVMNEYPKYKSRAEEAREYILENYKEDKMYEMFAEMVCPKNEANIEDWLASMSVEEI